MNKHLQEALVRQKIRNAHRDAVKKSKRINEGHPLWDAFVQPFVDQIKAAELLGKDLMNVLSLAWDTVFTLSPKKKKEARERFMARKGAIDKEWQPLMEKAEDALGNKDLALVSFLANPAMFFTGKAAQKSYEAAGGFNKWMGEAGWNLPLVKMLPGMSEYTGPTPDEVKASQKAAEEGRSLLDRLAGLFYIENAWLEGDLIVEQDENKKLPPLEKEMEKFMQQSGLQDMVDETAKKFIESEQEYVDAILEDALPRLALAKTLAETSDVEEFVQALKNAESEGIEMDGGGANKMKADIDASAQKLVQDEEFVTQLRRQKAGVKGTDDDPEADKNLPEMSEQEALEAAQKIAFVNAKKSLEEKSREMITKLKEESIAAIEENKPKDATLPGLKGTKLGADYLKIYEEAKQKIDAA